MLQTPFFTTFLEFAFVYALGGLVYPLLEILFRGYSHWSMSLAGGVCMAAIHLVNSAAHGIPFPVKCLICAILITEVEFVIGCAVNIAGKMNVWDYSRQKFNFLGQICLEFFLVWILLSIPALFVSDQLMVFFANTLS